MPVSLFYNREVSGYDLENGSLNELAERIESCADDARCVALIEGWLLGQLHAAQEAGLRTNLRRMEAAVRRICTVPRTSVSELAAQACLSKKQFERSFRSCVGINPKAYARIVRFHRALNRMQSDPRPLAQAQIADACGYADQSHFIREFRRLGGRTPLSLAEAVDPSSNLFADLA